MIFKHLLNIQSHPTWVRGLKLGMPRKVNGILLSHPTWVRGLKLLEGMQLSLRKVAPYVGAWIETPWQLVYGANGKSHPTWVRGLKHKDRKNLTDLCSSRTLRGCVD